MALISSKGIGLEVKNITVNATGFTPITLDHATNAMIMQCRTAVDILIYADDKDVSEYFTMKSGTVLTIDVAGSQPDTTTDVWAKTNSGTAVIEIIGIY